eukprot:CAMPEP_0202444256 /NCGR_PEP_ID=MMETSP1360-20130828/3394_1 /ASSEMBLY_ACC=CAM_ASM_000848 /TAXON_ID=515479 /ORGANISM="Licmophora paradoxa, Strain CCMP2313" /LENGTH=680 /DNA_ID=CAMNT_0049060207 /DNA_START=73 /DNA_END=2115 /DNA_ORIENTATION=+
MRVFLFFSLCLSLVGAQSNPRQILSSVALQGGAEFNDPNSYQSQALRFVEQFRSTEVLLEMIQYYALACIFFATNGKSNKRTDVAFTQFSKDNLPGWRTNSSWVTSAGKCTWHGISCNGNFVSQIQLPDNRLFGTFPAEVSLLSQTLETLDLYLNFYLVTEGDDGNRWIADLTSLRELFFGTTSFEYNGIPTFIGALTNLEEIDVSNTFFTRGPIPSMAFTGLTLLTYIDMADNIYTSEIPNEISQLPNLQYLYIDNVNFLGVSQTLNFLIGMSAIFENWMDFTAFVGGLPTEMGQLSTLKSFSCCFCGLSGPIPSELGNLPALDRLWVYQNDLTGTIPTELGKLSSMLYLHVEGNSLQGTMPQEICQNRVPLQLIEELGADCTSEPGGTVDCPCCTCCSGEACDNFSDGTPSPTSSPTADQEVTIIPIAPGICFSGNTVVETIAGPTPIADLQVGDMVKNGDKFDEIFSFGHKAENMIADFVQIQVDGLHRELEISPNHMIFVEGGSSKPASTVVVGDKVMLAEGGLANVVSVKTVTSKGVHAPFTRSGKIAVNGIVASTYVTFQENSDSLLIGGHKVINMHWVSQISMAPHRLVCQFDMEICKGETYTDGMNSWMIGPYNFTMNVLSQGTFAKTAVFVPFFIAVCFSYLLEFFLSSPILTILGLATLVLYKKNKKVVA